MTDNPTPQVGYFCAKHREGGITSMTVSRNPCVVCGDIPTKSGKRADNWHPCDGCGKAIQGAVYCVDCQEDRDTGVSDNKGNREETYEGVVLTEEVLDDAINASREERSRKDVSPQETPPNMEWEKCPTCEEELIGLAADFHECAEPEISIGCSEMHKLSPEETLADVRELVRRKAFIEKLPQDEGRFHGYVLVQQMVDRFPQIAAYVEDLYHDNVVMRETIADFLDGSFDSCEDDEQCTCGENKLRGALSSISTYPKPE